VLLLLSVVAHARAETPVAVKPPDINGPAALTKPASGVGRSGAELNGTVAPNRTPTTYYFEYGETTAYGQQTPAGFAGADSTVHRVSTAVSGLSGDTTYHFRIVAQSAAGTATGRDVKFTTVVRGDPPPAVPLTAGWQYRADPGNAGLGANWSSGAPIPGAASVSVPHVFDNNPVVSEFGGSLGWYRLTFTPPAAPTGFGWAVRFAEVRRRSQVWLNGKSIGTTDDPYTPFVLPAAGLVPGRPNTLVVRADSRRLPGSPPEGWWNWGGIVRPVSLVPRGERVLRDPAVLPDVHCTASAECTASVIVDGDLETGASSSGDEGPVRIALKLHSPAGVVTEGSFVTQSPAGPGQSRHVRFSVPVPGRPDLWEPGHPALYQAEVTTEMGGSTLQVDRPQVGLRSVNVRHGRLMLNGRPINARGVSIHEDALGHGAALSGADLDRIVAEVRAVHANMVRAHYGLDERLLDRLDRAGILVWNEGPVWRADNWLAAAPDHRALALATLGRTVLAARNHPSVVVNCIGNEIDHDIYRTPAVLAYLTDAPALVRRLDPTRPVGVAVSVDDAILQRPEYRTIDVLGINEYFGWYGHRTDDLGPYLRKLRRAQRRPAIMVTEFGVEAFYHAKRRLRGSYEFQKRWIENTMQQIDHARGISGALHWTLREFRVYPGFTGGVGPELRLRMHQPYAAPENSLLTKGLLTYAGRRKPAWFALRRAFEREPFWADGRG
jgi:beta-glucuronidase